jgi:hypothetical protein
MRRIIPLSIFVPALVLGLLSAAGVLGLTYSEGLSPYARRVDEWHRLYEAAGMTGDSAIMKEVHDRLACANVEGQAHGVMIEGDQTVACKVNEDRVEELKYTPGSEHGSFWKLISDSHLTWSLENQNFLKTINNAEKARDYVRLHRWPQ